MAVPFAHDREAGTSVYADLLTNEPMCCPLAFTVDGVAADAALATSSWSWSFLRSRPLTFVSRDSETFDVETEPTVMHFSG